MQVVYGYRYTGGVQIQVYWWSTDRGLLLEYRYRYTGGVQIQVYRWSTDTGIQVEYRYKYTGGVGIQVPPLVKLGISCE